MSVPSDSATPAACERTDCAEPDLSSPREGCNGADAVLLPGCDVLFDWEKSGRDFGPAPPEGREVSMIASFKRKTLSCEANASRFRKFRWRERSSEKKQLTTANSGDSSAIIREFLFAAQRLRAELGLPWRIGSLSSRGAHNENVSLAQHDRAQHDRCSVLVLRNHAGVRAKHIAAANARLRPAMGRDESSQTDRRPELSRFFAAMPGARCEASPDATYCDPAFRPPSGASDDGFGGTGPGGAGAAVPAHAPQR